MEERTLSEEVETLAVHLKTFFFLKISPLTLAQRVVVNGTISGRWPHLSHILINEPDEEVQCILDEFRIYNS